TFSFNSLGGHSRPRNDTKVKNIWFIESASHRSLKFGQACAIESASLHNPRHTINLLTTANMSAQCEYCRILSALPNFRTQEPNLTEAFQSTPMEAWYRQGRYKRSRFRVEHLSDALRYATLWKHGGIYLDHDEISLKSLDGLNNCLVIENEGRPANGILIFDKGHRFLKTVMGKCAETYNPYEWAVCGPNVLERLYQNGESLARDLTYLKAETFLPVHWSLWNWLFDPKRSTSVFQMVRRSYGVHLSNLLSKNATFRIGSGSAYELLAIWNCPRVYEHLVSKKGAK
ncbi:unnamed protein product, partial [Ixodes hexagonus]